MILAAVQYRPPKGRPDEARRELVRLVSEACEEGAELVVCPEMATSGYVWPNRDALLPHSEPADGPTAAALGEVAARHGSWVLCGLPERVDLGGVPVLYNSALVIGPDGSVMACYRKVLLYDADTCWARPGDRRIVIETALGRLAPAICMDINADEFPGFLVAQGVEVLAFCTNWVEEGLDVHAYWRWRIGGWNGWMVAGNTWGADEDVVFSGRSAVLGPDGRVVAALARTGDGVLVVDTEVSKAIAVVS